MFEQREEAAPPSVAKPRWVPKLAGSSVTASSFGQSAWENMQSLVPLPPRAPPVKPRSRSGRLRQRFRNRKQAYRIGSGLIALINTLHTGSADTCKASRFSHRSQSTREAQELALRSLFSEAASFARDRRNFSTGGHHSSHFSGACSASSSFEVELRRLVKNLKQDSDGYSRRAPGPAQIPLLADRLVEPSSSETAVPMLEALPPLEAAFYECESNVVSWQGKSRVQVEELEEQ